MFCEVRVGYYFVFWRKYEEKLVGKWDGCIEIRGKSFFRCELLKILIVGRYDD